MWLMSAMIVQLLLLTAVAGAATGLSAAAWVVGVACGLVTDIALAHGLSHYRVERLTVADWVTLTRATLAAWLLGPALALFMLSNADDWTWHLAGAGAIFALALGGLLGSEE